MSSPVSRRHVLALGAAVGLFAALSGCTQPPAAAPIPPDPDELAVDRAVAAARTLRADALALVAARPTLAPLLRKIAQVHEDHLAALGSPIGDPASPPATKAATSGPTSAGATPTTAATPAIATTPSRLISAESAAAQVALRDGLAAAPAFAVLLCRIAAARIANADLISAAVGSAPPGDLSPAAAPQTASPSGSASGSASRTGAATGGPSAPAAGPTGTQLGTPTGSRPEPAVTDPAQLVDPRTPAEAALNRLLAGEHAAVFAYPLIVARSTGYRRSRADALWQAHRTERDELTARLLAAGVRPIVAEPAYSVGTLPTTSAAAATLAARVERGLAALATDLIAATRLGTSNGSLGATTPDATGQAATAAGYRRLGADQLALAARRAGGWSGGPTAFPGQVIGTPTATTRASGYSSPSSSLGSTDSPTGFTSPPGPAFPPQRPPGFPPPHPSGLATNGSELFPTNGSAGWPTNGTAGFPTAGATGRQTKGSARWGTKGSAGFAPSNRTGAARNGPAGSNP